MTRSAIIPGKYDWLVPVIPFLLSRKTLHAWSTWLRWNRIDDIFICIQKPLNSQFSRFLSSHLPFARCWHTVCNCSHSVAHDRASNEPPPGNSLENKHPLGRNDMLKTSTIVIAAVAVFGMTQLASAQGFYPETHYHNVPHTTTHTDYVRHGNHVDAVPHTTTHIDRVPHTTYRPINPWRPRYVPHTTTHIDYVPHGNHVDAVPHTTTHFHRVPRLIPHTTTHFDRVRHGNHSHVVPHTTTHWHRR